ncbi:unnamed protein product, partial [Amoebophrya sp. A25]
DLARRGEVTCRPVVAVSRSPMNSVDSEAPTYTNETASGTIRRDNNCEIRGSLPTPGATSEKRLHLIQPRDTPLPKAIIETYFDNNFATHPETRHYEWGSVNTSKVEWCGPSDTQGNKNGYTSYMITWLQLNDDTIQRNPHLRQPRDCTNKEFVVAIRNSMHVAGKVAKRIVARTERCPRPSDQGPPSFDFWKYCRIHMHAVVTTGCSTKGGATAFRWKRIANTLRND